MFRNIFQPDNLYSQLLTQEIISARNYPQLMQIKNMTVHHSDICAMIHCYSIEEPIIRLICEKDVININQLYQIMGESLPQAQFSQAYQSIQLFIKRTEQFLRNQLANRCQAALPNNWLSFAVYRRRDGIFCIKAKVMHLQMIECDTHLALNGNGSLKPMFFLIDHLAVTPGLVKVFDELVNSPVLVSQPINQLYESFYSRFHFQVDQEILQLQLKCRYTLLRLKMGILLTFKDDLTKQPFNAGAIVYANGDQYCMYGHLTGYSAISGLSLIGRHCPSCKRDVHELKQHPILNHLLNHPYNPSCQPILYYPEYNRFSVVFKDSNGIQVAATTSFMHLRTNLLKQSTKTRTCKTFTDNEIFPLTTNIISRVDLPIRDPVKGLTCCHQAFSDLRDWYVSREITASGLTYQCPISSCRQVYPQSDLIYLRQILPLLHFFTGLVQDHPYLTRDARCIINHLLRQVYIELHGNAMSNPSFTEVKGIYPSLLNPFVFFDEGRLMASLPSRQKNKQDMDNY